jgi:hypothetical protein
MLLHALQKHAGIGEVLEKLPGHDRVESLSQPKGFRVRVMNLTIAHAAEIRDDTFVRVDPHDMVEGIPEPSVKPEG